MNTLRIGALRRPHGVRGAIKVESYSGEADHFRSLHEVDVIHGAQRRTLEVVSVDVHNGTPVLRFKGIDTPEEAKRFGGWEIVVPRELAAPTGENEYYIEDLIDARVLYTGQNVGTIESVVEGGQSQLLEVRLDEPDGANRTVLVPFLNRFIGTVDVVARTVELRERWILDTESRS